MVAKLEKKTEGKMHIAVSGLFLGARDEQKNAGLQSTVWHFASSTNRAQPNNAMNFLFDRTKHVGELMPPKSDIYTAIQSLHRVFQTD